MHQDSPYVVRSTYYIFHTIIIAAHVFLSFSAKTDAVIKISVLLDRFPSSKCAFICLT